VRLDTDSFRASAGEREPLAAEDLEMHPRAKGCGLCSSYEQHIDDLLHDGIGVKVDGTRRRLARNRNGRLIRKGTERIGEGFEVGALGGEQDGDEEQADGAAAHAKCLRLRQGKTCETRKCAAQSKRLVFPFLLSENSAALEFGHILASSCQVKRKGRQGASLPRARHRGTEP
jgi:hypothetical protein